MVGPRTETHAALLDAAAELFAAKGYRNTSHADVSAAAFSGRTTFYEYFDSMEDLLVQLVESWLPPWIEETLASIPKDLPADLRMAEVCSRMISFVATDNLGLVLHDDVRCLSPQMQQRIGVAHRELATTLTEIYVEGVQAQIFRSMPPALVGALIDATIMAAARTLMNSDDPKGQVHEVSDSAIEFLLSGLGRI